MGAPSVINIAALSLAMERLAVHEISGGAIRLVHSADLRSIPDRPPKLMQHAWLIESADLHAPLWGDTVCLGGYELDGIYYLVGLRYPDGAMVARWTPKWGSGEKDIDVPLDRSPLIDDVEGHCEWAQAAAPPIAAQTPICPPSSPSLIHYRKHAVSALAIGRGGNKKLQHPIDRNISFPLQWA